MNNTLTKEDERILQNLKAALPVMGSKQKGYFLGYLAALKDAKLEQLKEQKQQA